LSNWQPIKTAPKDGTVIDVWIGGEFAGRVADVIFSEHPHQCASQYCDSCPDEEEAAGYACEICNHDGVAQ
jgi:hypothetical protein